MAHEPDSLDVAIALCLGGLVFLLLKRAISMLAAVSRWLTYSDSLPLPQMDYGVLPMVKVHHIETDPRRRARCLKHLLKANHVNYSIVYNKLRLSNQTAHLLASAYTLGAGEDRLNELYGKEIRSLEPWAPSPAEIVDADWRNFVGDRSYQRAYVDFFEDKLAMKFGYDWKLQVQQLFFNPGRGDKSLLHGLIGGLGHPLVHLGFAYEFDSKEIAMESLALACIQQNFLQKYASDATYTRPSEQSSSSPTILLHRLSRDERFQRLPDSPDSGHLEAFFDQHVDLAMEYWNAWKLCDELQQFSMSQEAAVALLLGTWDARTKSYNFFVAHLLAASHGVRVLLPNLAPQYRVALMRDWWLLVIAVYIMIGRPQFAPSKITESDLGGKDWAHVTRRAISISWSQDGHFLKCIRAIREAARTWGDLDGKYLCAAVTFVDTFSGWS
ncbi:hypothetical protein CDD82_5963 [Ophiocordyceps australis]|uniref:MGS207 protein n=1 Tax=Ophiocordyceps australis TaxID=1399860 RepID=A0A2C5YZK4_9HYPO|nr:hypothetical protein CDD82_5963 [Ophiocordyceps australis]